MLSLILAQTLGIAPAQRLILTPFAILNCYLNITDDLGAGVSLFKAELLRAKDLLEHLRALLKNSFAFTLMDEIFSGTSPEEGAHAAVQFARNLSGFANSISILATHYPQLTMLATELPHSFDNYKVSIFRNNDGSWNRPFKIEKGVSDINIAMELLKDEGIL